MHLNSKNIKLYFRILYWSTSEIKYLTPLKRGEIYLSNISEGPVYGQLTPSRNKAAKRPGGGQLPSSWDSGSTENRQSQRGETPTKDLTLGTFLLQLPHTTASCEPITGGTPCWAQHPWSNVPSYATSEHRRFGGFLERKHNTAFQENTLFLFWNLVPAINSVTFHLS